MDRTRNGVEKMRTTVKVYLVFDNIYLNEQDAVNALDGWEHKEKVIPCFMSIGESNLNEIVELDLDNQIEYMACLSPCLHDTYEQAKEETRELNYEYHD